MSKNILSNQIINSHSVIELTLKEEYMVEGIKCKTRGLNITNAIGIITISG